MSSEPQNGICYPSDGRHRCPFCNTPTKALWELNHSTNRLRVRDKILHLTPIGADILAALSEPPGRVLSQERLLTRVYGLSGASRTELAPLWVHLHTLRKQLQTTDGALEIATIKGRGYVLLQGEYEPMP